MSVYDWEFKASDLKVIGTRYARFPVIIGDFIEKNLRSVGMVVAGLMRKKLKPVKYTGALERSVSTEYTANPPDYSITIGPTAKHAQIVRTGTRPHWVPIEPLKRWAYWKLGDENAAYAVQRSIAKHGTSRYLAQRGIPGAEQTEYGIGFNYIRLVREDGRFQTGIERTQTRIGIGLSRFLGTGETQNVTLEVV